MGSRENNEVIGEDLNSSLDKDIMLSERPDYQVVITSDKDNEVITNLNQDFLDDDMAEENQNKLNFLGSVSDAYDLNKDNSEMSKNFKLGLFYDNIGMVVERGVLSKLGVLSAMRLVDGDESLNKMLGNGDILILEVLYQQGLSVLNMLNNIEFREIRNFYFNGQATDKDLVHVNQLYVGYLTQYLENKYLKIIGHSTEIHDLDFTEDELRILDEFLLKLCEFLHEPSLSTTGYPVELEKDVVEVLHKHFK